MLIRKPYCSKWYPNQLKEIEKYFNPKKEKAGSRITFAVVPHAGWIFSGKVAGAVYSHMDGVDTAIILATNHTGLGAPSSLYPKGTWEMPLGPVRRDDEFSMELLKHCGLLEEEAEAHRYEHAVEVQLPFLQALNPKMKLVPIEMRDYRFEACREIGHGIAKSVENLLKKDPNKTFCLLASSDMTHCGQPYGQLPPGKISPAEFAKSQDHWAIEQILDLNPAGLLKTVEERNITMCGSGPAAAMIETAKALGAKRSELLSYASSADQAGNDPELAVGYAGILIN